MTLLVHWYGFESGHKINLCDTSVWEDASCCTKIEQGSHGWYMACNQYGMTIIHTKSVYSHSLIYYIIIDEDS